MKLALLEPKNNEEKGIGSLLPISIFRLERGNVLRLMHQKIV